MDHKRYLRKVYHCSPEECFVKYYLLEHDQFPPLLASNYYKYTRFWRETSTNINEYRKSKNSCPCEQPGLEYISSRQHA